MNERLSHLAFRVTRKLTVQYILYVVVKLYANLYDKQDFFFEVT